MKRAFLSGMFGGVGVGVGEGKAAARKRVKAEGSGGGRMGVGGTLGHHGDDEEVEEGNRIVVDCDGQDEDVNVLCGHGEGGRGVARTVTVGEAKGGEEEGGGRGDISRGGRRRHSTLHAHASSDEGGRQGARHTATHCNTLQHAAAHCNTLQHTRRGALHATHDSAEGGKVGVGGGRTPKCPAAAAANAREEGDVVCIDSDEDDVATNAKEKTLACHEASVSAGNVPKGARGRRQVTGGYICTYIYTHTYVYILACPLARASAGDVTKGVRRDGRWQVTGGYICIYTHVFIYMYIYIYIYIYI